MMIKTEVETDGLAAALKDHQAKLAILAREEALSPEYYLTPKGKLRKKRKPIWFYIIDPGDSYQPYELYLRIQLGA